MPKYGCSLLQCTFGCCVIRQRVVVSILCLFGIIVSYSQRVVLSITITKIVSTDVRQFINECLPGNESISVEMGPTKEWNETIQQGVLLSFFTGYLIGHIPAGIFSDKIGPKRVYFMGILISTAMTLATPFVVMLAPWVIVIVVRVICGFAQAVIYPCISILIARYIPPEERGLMGAFSMASSYLGVFLGNLLTGQITNLAKDWRWPFYFWTLLGVVWCALYFLYVFDDPNMNPRMLDDEKQFIMANIPQAQKLKIPWKGILTDKGIWGLMIGSLGSDFWIYLLLTNLPKYMGTVLHMQMNMLSLATSLPSILAWVSSLICGKIVDWTITKKHTDLTWNRRITSTLGVVLPISFTVVIGHVGCNKSLVIIFYSLSNLTRGPFYCSLRINHLDLTQNFCGIVMALINGFGCFAGIISPIIVGYFAKDNTLKNWCLVFWIICLINLACQIIYCCLAYASRAPWDTAAEDEPTK